MKPPTIDEQLSNAVHVDLTDADGNPAPPISVTYRIDCLTSGAQILAPVVLSTPGASFDVTVPSALNAIVDQSNPQEYRRMTVEALYANADLLSGQFDWVVNNLSFVS